MITTASVAWRRLGRSNFRDHVLVFEKEGRYDMLPTMLIKMSPWSREEVVRATEFMTRSGAESYILSENPLRPDESFLSDAFYSGALPDSLVEILDYAAWPATDDQPYFGFLRRKIEILEPDPTRFLNSSIAWMLNKSLLGGVIPLDWAHLIAVGLAATVFGLAFVLLPLWFSGVGRTAWANKSVAMFYFACLGAGFIMIELTLIQVFMKVIGYPIYAYSTVIFTMLLGAGLGSLSASLLGIAPRRHWWLPFAGTLGCGALLWVVKPAVFAALLAAPVVARVAVTAVLILPLAWFMGMALPLGILAIMEKPRGAIAWAWGMNGLFTVIGGLAAVVLSILIGFEKTLLVAFAIYVAAAVAFARLRETAPAFDTAEPIAEPVRADPARS